MKKNTQTKQPFLRTRIVTGGIFIALAPLLFFNAGVFASLQNDTKIQESMAAVDNGLHADQLYLQAQSNELNEQGAFDRHLESGEVAELLSAAIAEKHHRNLDELVITDAKGVVVTRTNAVQQRGDYFLHSTSWGREALAGNAVASVAAGSAHTLLVQGSVPMERNEQLHGAITSVYIVNDAYAIRSQEKWLPEGTHIAFHVPDSGIIADSFSNEAYSKILAFYFTDGMDDLSSTSIQVAIKGDQYLVHSVALKGVAASPGQMLIFIPSEPLFMQVVSAIVLAMFLLGSALLLPLLVDRKHRRLFWFVTALVCGVGAALAFLLYADYTAKNVISLSRPHYTIYNSTLELDPSSATLSRQFEYRVGIKLRSGGEAINATEVVLAYDPQKVVVSEINFSRSFCNKNLILQRDIDPVEGLVHIICGLPNPGFSERSGIIADIFLQPTGAGLFTLQFSPETKVLANDGLGTEVLRYAIDGSYNIAQPSISTDSYWRQLLIFSPTHRNQERWYSNKDVVFTWAGSSESTYRYSLKHFTDGEILATTSTIENQVEFMGLNNGIHYLALESSHNGDMQHAAYKVKIDNEPPVPPRVSVSNDRPQTGELIRFEFTGSDALSGLQSNFYLKFDDGIFFPIGDSFVTAFYEPGEHVVTVRSFDLANNFSDTAITIIVQSPIQQMQAALGSLLKGRK